MRGQQAANLDQWSDKLDDSPDHALDKAAFKKDLDSGQISQKGYDSVVTRQKRLVDADQKQASLEAVSYTHLVQARELGHAQLRRPQRPVHVLAGHDVRP